MLGSVVFKMTQFSFFVEEMGKEKLLVELCAAFRGFIFLPHSFLL